MQRMPPVELLPSLVALLETSSVTKAASRMHVSQPAMSRTLQRLRDVVGDELLVRAGNRLTCTLRAEEIRPAARALLDQAQVLLAPTATFSPTTAQGKVTLALGDDMQALLAGKLLANLRKAAPSLDVRVRTLDFESAPAMLRGHIDLMVLPDIRAAYPALDSEQLIFTPCYVRRFVTVTRRPGRLALRRFIGAKHLLVSPGGDDRGYVDEALRDLGQVRRVVATVPTFQAALALVRQSDLVATLPDDVARHLATGLHVQPCPVATPSLDVCVVWGRRFEPDPRHSWLRTLVMKTVRDLAGVPGQRPAR